MNGGCERKFVQEKNNNNNNQYEQSKQQECMTDKKITTKISTSTSNTTKTTKTSFSNNNNKLASRQCVVRANSEYTLWGVKDGIALDSHKMLGIIKIVENSNNHASQTRSEILW